MPEEVVPKSSVGSAAAAAAPVAAALPDNEVRGLFGL